MVLLQLAYLKVWDGCCKVECPSQAVQMLLDSRPQSRHVHRFQHTPQHAFNSAFQHCLSLQQSPEYIISRRCIAEGF